jgi:hypothetical protein
VPLTLDCLSSYLDPQLAPDDFVTWLAAGWGWRWTRAPPRQGLHVRVTAHAGAVVDPAWLDRFVAALKPAHLPHTVEVVPQPT